MVVTLDLLRECIADEENPSLLTKPLSRENNEPEKHPQEESAPFSYKPRVGLIPGKDLTNITKHQLVRPHRAALTRRARSAQRAVFDVSLRRAAIGRSGTTNVAMRVVVA